MIISYQDLKKLNGARTTFVVGTFDLLHVGHLFFLDKAKSIEPKNKLLVGVISDKIVKENKGQERPIVSEKQRAEMLNALKIVGNVFVAPPIKTGKFVKEILENFKPSHAAITESSWKTRKNPFPIKNTNVIVIKDEAEGISTSKIIERIKNLKEC